MIIKAVSTAVFMAALSSSALAQGFSGGELTMDISTFSEGNNPTAMNYSGALEYAISRDISVAAAVSVYDFSLLNQNITNTTVHGVYHLNDQASVGAFIGRDSVSGFGTDFYGLEGGYESGQFEVEGYFALYDNPDNTSILGVSGAYSFNESLAAIGTLGSGDIGSQTFTRISAGTEYTFAQGPSVYAEIGNVSGANVDSGFITLGASIEFGADRGTTFDRRGVFETINPGF